jgi:mRNA interferase MazF
MNTPQKEENGNTTRGGFRGKAKRKTMNIRRGDIYYADLSPVIGSEQGGLRPVLIVQNDVGNRYSPTVIAAAITSKMGKTKLPTHIDVFADKVGLAKDSIILLEQVRTLDKKRLKERMGHLDDDLMQEVNNAISISFGLSEMQSDAYDSQSRVYMGRDKKAEIVSPSPVKMPDNAVAISREEVVASVDSSVPDGKLNEGTVTM